MPTKEPREFYKFSGTYQIAPGTTAEQMASDAACLLDSAESIVDAVINGFCKDVPPEDQSLIFSVGHFVTMAKNLCQAVQADLERAAGAKA